MRWEKMRDGSQRGHFIDMGIEARIGFLIEVASAHQSIRFAELAVEAAERLAASWYHEFPEFGVALRADMNRAHAQHSTVPT
jgi:hypothetical protein